MIIPTTLEPAPDPVVADNEPVEEAPPAVRPARPAPRAAAPNPEPPTAETPETPPVVLTTGNAGELAARAEQHLTRARQSLSRVAVNQLGRDGRAQYDEVRRFIRLAEEKLRTRNYVYANELAERAALLASLLSRD